MATSSVFTELGVCLLGECILSNAVQAIKTLARIVQVVPEIEVHLSRVIAISYSLDIGSGVEWTAHTIFVSPVCNDILRT